MQMSISAKINIFGIMLEQCEIVFLFVINRTKLKKKNCPGLMNKSIGNMPGWQFYGRAGNKCPGTFLSKAHGHVICKDFITDKFTVDGFWAEIS